MPFKVNSAVMLVACTPYAIQWSGGHAPYHLAITAGGDITSILETFPSTEDTSYTWKVDQPAGTTVTFVVTDATGQTAMSAASGQINKGSDESCLKDGGDAPDKATPTANDGDGDDKDTDKDKGSDHKNDADKGKDKDEDEPTTHVPAPAPKKTDVESTPPPPLPTTSDPDPDPAPKPQSGATSGAFVRAKTSAGLLVVLGLAAVLATV